MPQIDMAFFTEEFKDIIGEQYEPLRQALDQAYHRAAYGKGNDRHGTGLPFAEQPMQHILDLVGPGYATGQICKKAQESHRLPRDRAVQELLDVIVYAAGLVVWIERKGADEGSAGA
jgi:hypothetical protein